MNSDTLNIQKRISINYWSDINMLPIFIDNKNYNHIKCRELVVELLERLQILIEPRIINKRIINRLWETYNICLSEMVDIDSIIAILYYDYIRDLLQCYKDYCIEGELYESAQNITSFLDYYKKMEIE